MSHLGIRHDRLAALRRRDGLERDADLGRAMRVSHATIHRLTNKTCRPGESIVAGFLRLWPMELANLLYVVEQVGEVDEPAEAAAS